MIPDFPHNTARPRDARFLVPEKNRAAQNRASWGLYLCTKVIFFSKNRLTSRLFFKIRVLQVFLWKKSCAKRTGLNGHYFSVCSRMRHDTTMGWNCFWKSFFYCCIFMRYFSNTFIVWLFNEELLITGAPKNWTIL